MKDFLKEIIRLWWVEGGTELKNPKSEASIKALRVVLKEELDFPNEVIEYIIENIKTPITHFAYEPQSSGINVGDNQTAVSAQLHPDWDDEDLNEDDEEAEEPENDKEKVDADIKQNALTAYEKDKLKENLLIEIGMLISEASIFQDKYGYGHKVMWSSTGQKSFANSLEDGAPMMTMPAIKVKPQEDVIKVGGGNGVEVYLKGANAKVYHCVGRGSTVGGWFKHYVSNTDFKLDTDGKETASLLGVYMNAEKYLQEFNAADDETLPGLVTRFKNDVAATLTGQDWVSTKLVGMLSKASLPNILQVCAIAAGMDRFCKTKGIKGYSIIHKSIETYYKAEMQNPYTKTEGGKNNTADCVVLKGSPGSFLKNMATEKISYEANGLCKLASGEEFYQISLKQAEGEAQLGKITSDFASTFGMLSNNDLVNMFIHENVQLDEGLRDLFNKGLEFVKSVGKKVVDKIYQISNKFTSFFQSNLKSLQSGQKKSEKKVDNFIMKLKVDKKYLNEELLLEKKGKVTMEDKIEGIAKDANAMKGLYKFADTQFQSVIKKTQKPGLKSVGDTSFPVSSNHSADLVRKLMANAKAYDCISRMIGNVPNQEKDLRTLFEDMLDLEKEMYFGRTSLPLVKVFGLKSNGSGTAWSFLKTGKEFVEERVSAFADMPENVLIVDNSAQSDGYMSVSTLMLSSLNPKTQEPMYNMVTMRTNSSNTTTFVIEGSKVVSLSYVKKNTL